MADRLALFTGGALRGLARQDRARHPALRPARGRARRRRGARPAGVANEVVPYARRPVPIVAQRRRGRRARRERARDRRGAVRRRADRRVARGAAGGDRAPGCDVEAGLHTVLAEDPELSEAAAARGRRAARPARRAAGPERARGPAERPDVRVVHTVGSDCAIGKMSVTLELDAAARARGLESAFVATGPDRDRDHRLGDRRRPRDLGLRRRRGRAAGRGGRRARAAAVRRGPGRARAPGLLRRHARAAARLPARRAGALPPRGSDRASTTTRRPPIPPLPRARRDLRARRRLGPPGAGARRSRSTRAGSTTTRRAPRSPRARERDRPARRPTRCASAASALLEAVV